MTVLVTGGSAFVGGALCASLSESGHFVRLAQQIHAISSAGLSVIFPKISRKIEGSSSFTLRKIAHLAIMGNFFVSSGLAIILFMVGHDILLIRLGTSIARASSEILFYLTIGYWLLAMNVAPNFILLAIGRMKISMFLVHQFH